jgi:hypothetical protein
MSQMGLHDPFGYLEHKLWPKERSGVKLAIWLSTTKSQESFWFPCVKVACHILLKSSRKGLQLFLRPHLNWRFAHKVMGLQNWRSSNFGISRLPLGSPRTKWHLSANFVARHKKYYKGGRWWFPPSLSHGESCESMFARGSSMHKKCSNYVLINLLFGLCKSVWVIDLLVNLPSPHCGTPTCPFTLEMLWAEECAQLCHLPLFSPLDSQLSPSCSFEVRHSCCYL